MEFDVSIEEDDVTLRGHAVAKDGVLDVRMCEPCIGDIVVRSTFLYRLPRTEDGMRRCAETAMVRFYRQKRDRDAVRDSKTAEEWRRVGDEAHRRIRSLNIRMRLMHEVVMGTAKSDLKKGLLPHAEYMRARQSFRDRTADARLELGRLASERAHAKSFAAELDAAATPAREEGDVNVVE